MHVSIEFYSKLLELEPKYRNKERWVEFHGNNFCIALLNPQFDHDLINSGQDISQHYNMSYLEFKKKPILYGNNVVLNFWVEDLNQEYQRVKQLHIGDITNIFFINVVMPYYCFMMTDPDGNMIEIAGKWEEPPHDETTGDR